MSNESDYYAYQNDKKRLREARKALEEINGRIDNKTATSKDFDERDILKERIKKIKWDWNDTI